MRTLRSILSPLAAAALVAAAFQPAAAQRAATVSPRPAVRHVAATPDTPAVRTLATYRFGLSNVVGMPSLVTVADSAGALVASFRRSDSREAVPMVVDVLDTDVTLLGTTPAGVLTLVLYGLNDPSSSSALLGRWTLGSRRGELWGRVAR